MSEMPSTGSSVEKRRMQAQERRRKRADLNRHYMEEEALRALDAGSLKVQTARLSSKVYRALAEVKEWLGSDINTIINQAICYTFVALNDERTNVNRDFLNDHMMNYVIQRRLLMHRIELNPTPETVRILIRSQHRNALSLYSTIGILVIHRSLKDARSDLKRSITDALMVQP